VYESRMWQELYMGRAGLWTLLHSEMHVNVDVNWCLKFDDPKWNLKWLDNFVSFSYIKCHENPVNFSQVVTGTQMDRIVLLGILQRFMCYSTVVVQKEQDESDWYVHSQNACMYFPRTFSCNIWYVLLLSSL
jgi:hypothetical protein